MLLVIWYGEKCIETGKAGPIHREIGGDVLGALRRVAAERRPNRADQSLNWPSHRRYTIILGEHTDEMVRRWTTTSTIVRAWSRWRRRRRETRRERRRCNSATFSMPNRSPVARTTWSGRKSRDFNSSGPLHAGRSSSLLTIVQYTRAPRRAARREKCTVRHVVARAANIPEDDMLRAHRRGPEVTLNFLNERWRCFLERTLHHGLRMLGEGSRAAVEAAAASMAPLSRSRRSASPTPSAAGSTSKARRGGGGINPGASSRH